MSGQRTPTSAPQSPPDPPPSLRSRNDLSSRPSHKEGREPSEHSPAQLSTHKSSQNLNPKSLPQTVPGTSQPSAHREDSRRSFKKGITQLPSPSTSPNNTVPKQEHKSKFRSSRSKMDSILASISSPSNSPSNNASPQIDSPSIPILQPPTSTVPALVGAYLLIHPLQQLSLLLDGVLPNGPSASQAATRFLRPHVKSAIRSITSLLSDINDLNIEIAGNFFLPQPRTEQEWLDVAWGVARKTESGIDEGSKVLRVAGEVVKVDVEREWRSWWYWVEVRQMEKRREREQKEQAGDGEWTKTEKAKKEERKGENAIEDGGGTAELDVLTLGIQGTALSGITKFWRDMSTSEKDAAEREFCLALRAQLKLLPKPPELSMDGEDMKQMTRAIETMEDVRAKEEAEWEKREKEAKSQGVSGRFGYQEVESIERNTSGKTTTQIARVRREEDKLRHREKQKSSSLAHRTRMGPPRSKAEGSTPGLSRDGVDVRDMDGDRMASDTGVTDGKRDRRREVAY